MANMQQAFAQVQRQLNSFFSFVGNKLRNFKSITRGEQVSYVVVGTGMVLVLISLVLFAV